MKQYEKPFLAASLVVLAILIGVASAQAQGALKVGDKAPDFPQPMASTAGEKPADIKIQMSDFLGKKNIVLAFYVADWTGG